MVLSSNTAATLIPIILRFVKPGSVIYSDCWKAYDKLDDPIIKEVFGFFHETLCHKYEFVCNDNPEIHTQTIESN
jgi:transposase-like protein